MRGAIFASFALCLLLFLALLAGHHSDSTPGNYCCLFPLLCVFFWIYRLISVVTFSWTGNGHEHGVVVEWIISACVWCLVSACSSSWYILYLFVRFFLWAPEHLCDHGLELWDQLMLREFNQSIINLSHRGVRDIKRILLIVYIRPLSNEGVRDIRSIWIYYILTLLVVKGSENWKVYWI